MALTDERADIRAAFDRAREFSGWEAIGVQVTHIGDTAPWDYEREARTLAASAGRVVDLGTGGGEVFARIAHVAATGACTATEEWHVNAAVAARRLGERGIPVVRASSLVTPFRPGSFDLVLSRHEAVEPEEVDRILAPGGTFLTQQVAPEHWPELKRWFPRATVFADHWTAYPEWFRAHGYEVKIQRHDYQAAFATVADLAFMLAISPWEIPGFAYERDIDALLALEREALGPAGIVLSEGRYLLSARKPAIG